MNLQQNVPLGPKTTMRIGGQARWYAELSSKKDVEEAYQLAREKNIPLIVLGGGSNTVFADGVIEAMVVRVKGDKVTIRPPLPNPPPKGEGILVTVQSGKILASLINELAEQNLDLSPLTGIPGTVGGAIFGNAGQGMGGIWIGLYVQSVEVYVDEEWRTYSKEECEFEYRDSVFKNIGETCHTERSRSATHSAVPWFDYAHHDTALSPIIWSITLNVPSKPSIEVKSEIERLIQKRIETQPHLKTAGSCFKAAGDTPAWKLIDKAGLRGKQLGDIQIAEKHANFLLNTGKGTFLDAKKMVEMICSKVPEKLDVEMRFVNERGEVIF